jgi:hypothetical protein
MEERRFDDLTRALGHGASRRTVLKGLAVGLLGGLLGRSTATVDAAGGICSTQEYQACESTAKAQYHNLAGHCGTINGPPGGKAACKIAASVWYARALNQCLAGQCPRNMACVNDHCCRGQSCCQSEQLYCPGQGLNGSGGTCCPAGSVCCEGGCCTPDKTCCLDYNLTFFNPSAAEVCTDLQTDPKNCGSCRHQCDGLPCIDGTCQCPAGNTICHGPRNQTCCQPNEYCQSNAFGSVECVPRCSPCETYDPTNTAQPCQPLECDACQECDPQSGQCIPSEIGTSCGSDLSCCGGQCVSETCQGAQTFNTGSCRCECPPVSCPNGGQPNPTTCECDDKCALVTCQPCSECDPDTGQCVQSQDGTSCGTGLVCEQGECTAPCTPCSDYTYGCCPAGQGCALVGLSDGQTQNTVKCCPVDADHPIPGTALPDGTCCPPGSDAYHLHGCPLDGTIDKWICCPDTAQGVYGCCAYA